MHDVPVTGKHFRLVARIEHVDPLREQFAHFLRENGLREKEVDAWRLALTEALTNAIKHGSGNDPAKSVEVEWRIKGDEVELLIGDEGQGPQKSLGAIMSNLPADPVKTDGRGLYLIRQFCDRMEHWKGDHGYRQLIVRKHTTLIPFATPSGAEWEQALEEISLCYESLAAFYQLGEALIQSHSISTFINKALENMLVVVKADYVAMSFADGLQQYLMEDLRRVECGNLNSSEACQPFSVISDGEEFIWETLDEVKDHKLLARFKSGFCCPIKADGAVLGCLSIARYDNTPYLNAAELNTMRTFADLIGIAVAHADNQVIRTREQRALREMEIGADIQEELLPTSRVPESDDWQVFIRRKSAREVGGDYVEACLSRNGDLVLVCVDVMGKGISAAFLAVMVRTVLHMNLSLDRTMLEIIQSLNEILCREVGAMNMFVTCSLVRISCSMDNIEVINAGHCPVILLQNDQIYEQIVPSGPPLGIFNKIEHTVERYPLSGNESLLMVTDGLYEWRDQEPRWQWEDFVRFVEKQLPLEPEQLWAALTGKTRQAQNGHDSRDDQTMLFWKFK